jgi:hypothetical protein
MIASSIGAGRIVVTAIDGFPVEVTGAYPTLVVVAHDEWDRGETRRRLAERASTSPPCVSRSPEGWRRDPYLARARFGAWSAALQRIRGLTAVKTLRVIDRSPDVRFPLDAVTACRGAAPLPRRTGAAHRSR